MFREIEPRARNEAIQRHPDGSINFDAYRAIAGRERRAAIAASIESAAHAAHVLVASFGTLLDARSAKHPPHHAN